MSAVNGLSVKAVSEVGMAEDIHSKEFSQLENELKACFPVFEFVGKSYITEKIEISKLIDNGILCNVVCKDKKTKDKKTFVRFIPERLLKGVDLDDKDHLATFAKNVAVYWKEIKAEIEIPHGPITSATRIAFSEPNTLFYRHVRPSKKEASSHYMQQEMLEWEKPDLSTEKILLLWSKCILKSSLHKESWKLVQSNIEDCFLFFPVIDRAIYRDVRRGESKVPSAAANKEEIPNLYEHLFFSLPIKAGRPA